jgi:hypothetical protein
MLKRRELFRPPARWLPLEARLRRLARQSADQVAAASVLAGFTLAAQVYLLGAGLLVPGGSGPVDPGPPLALALALLAGALGFGGAQLLQLGSFRRSYRDATLLMRRSELPLQIADYTHLASMFDLLRDGDSASAVPQVRPHSLEEQIQAAGTLLGVLSRESSASEDSIRGQLRQALQTLQFVRSGSRSLLAIVIVSGSLHPLCWLNPLLYLSLLAWRRRSAVLGASAAICDQFAALLASDRAAMTDTSYFARLARAKAAKS